MGMRTVPARPLAVQLLGVVGALVAGPLLASLLSPRLSPGSGVIAAVAPMLFGLVLFFGILLWVGLGLFTALLAGLGRLVRGARFAQSTGAGERLVPPGYLAFVLLGGLAGLGLGVAGALLSPAALLPSIGGWLAAGLGYGALLWGAAHWGYLPFPEED